jgi:hypothetical protein
MLMTLCDQLALLGHRHVVEIEKVPGSGRFQPTNIAAAGGAAVDQRADFPFAQENQTFPPEPPIEQHCRRLGQWKQDDAVEIQEGEKSRGHPQRVARKIGLRRDLAEQGDHDCRKEEGAKPGQHRIGQQRNKYVGADIAPDHGGQHLIGILA